LASGSLYPILMRLSERGLLEAAWEEMPARGRPPRHLYRLTPAGLEAAREPRPAPKQVGRPQTA
jgi:DNA-binding PadR family transcriptional regulator